MDYEQKYIVFGHHTYFSAIRNIEIGLCSISAYILYILFSLCL